MHTPVHENQKNQAYNSQVSVVSCLLGEVNIHLYIRSKHTPAPDAHDDLLMSLNTVPFSGEYKRRREVQKRNKILPQKETKNKTKEKKTKKTTHTHTQQNSTQIQIALSTEATVPKIQILY